MIEERLNYTKNFLRELFIRFQQDKCSSVAAELTITSLLALVPLTTLVFALLALVPNFDDMALRLQQFLFAYFVPASGDSIQSYLVEFVEKAKNMSGIGFLMLIVTALMMMKTIENSFNHIWKIKKTQSRVRTFLVYWAVLTLGPIALGASIVITSYINSLPLINEVVADNSIWFRNLLPLFMACIAFSVMYYVIPNRKILVRDTIISAFIAAILFEAAKAGFGLFVKYFSTYELIFGALATIPLFLIWIYVSWNIVLFGAEICFGLSEFEFGSTRPKTQTGNKILRKLLAINALIQAQGEGYLLEINDPKKQKGKPLGFDASDLAELKALGLVTEPTELHFCLIANSKDIDFVAIFADASNKFPSGDEIMATELNDDVKSQMIGIVERFNKAVQEKLMVARKANIV